MKKCVCRVVIVALGLSSISLAGDFDKLNAYHMQLYRGLNDDLSLNLRYDYEWLDTMEDRYKVSMLPGNRKWSAERYLQRLVEKYEPSELPGWDVDFTFGGGLIEADVSNISGLHYESDIKMMHFGINARKDKMLVRTILHREDFEGKNVFEGIDSENVGVLFMPGYRVWAQQENGLDVDVFGQLDVSFLNNERSDNAWYVIPGARVEVRRATQVGLFRGAYSFNHARNIDGDREITNKGHINQQGWLFDYLTLITDTLFARAGISHAMVDDTPAGVEGDYTAMIVGLGTMQSSSWNLRVNYFQAIDGRNDRGFIFEMDCGWK